MEGVRHFLKPLFLSGFIFIELSSFQQFLGRFSTAFKKGGSLLSETEGGLIKNKGFPGFCIFLQIFSFLTTPVSIVLFFDESDVTEVMQVSDSYSMEEAWFARKSQLDRDLYMARQLQQNLLPPVIAGALTQDESPYFYAKPHYNQQGVFVSGFYNPCDALGGDLYDVFALDSETLLMTMMDVSGHGVAASLITAMAKAAILRLSHQTSSPAEILTVLNQELKPIVQTGDYVTAWIGVFNHRSLCLTHARAGHPQPIHYQACSEEIKPLEGGGLILGCLPETTYEEFQVPFEPGDALCVMTDGAYDIQNNSGDFLGYETLKAIIHKASQASSPIQLDQIVLTLSDYCQGFPVSDDISLLLLEVDNASKKV
jgi:phosphoserine phosphatase RsbU/P